jgi:glyoxylase-like metal-dependent hydrolase (beta-lactamase superfamily II)
MGMYAKYPKHQDRTFKPNKELSEGDEIKEVDHTLIAIHTPGHASNHICFFLEEEKMLFTGDHIMEGSTVVISPPDGNMREYIDSLEKLKALGIETIAPGHGETMRDANAVVDWIVSHRMFREKKVIDAITELNRASLDVLLNKVYDDVDPRLLSIAKYSLQAHLIKLVEEERVTQDKSEFVWNH